jgi:hypothetical protein
MSRFKCGLRPVGTSVKIEGMIRTFSIALAFASLMPATWAADTVRQGDRDFVMSNMHATRKMFLDSVASLTDAQWNFKAGPDRWSIAECAEHIAISEDFIAGISKQALATPAAPEKVLSADAARAKDEKIAAAVPDRTQKFQAPEPIKPTHRFKTPQEAVDHFKQSRDKNIAYVEKTDAPLREHFAKHPVMGELDALDWYLLMSAHTERHTKQILEVKADPGYPK